MALFVCAITLFIVISLFGQSLIQPTTVPLDGVGVEGKVILSAESNITADDLDAVASETEAGYILFNRELSEFTVTVPRGSGMLQAYEVTCIYSPYEYNLTAGNAVLVLPVSCRNDAGAIISSFVNAGVGIEEVSTQTTFEGDGVYLYLSHADLTDYGKKMQAINSVMRLGEDETTVYTFEIGEDVEAGSVNLINSNYYAASGRTAVFTAKADKSYTVVDTSEKREANLTNMRMEGEISKEEYQECRQKVTDEIATFQKKLKALVEEKKEPDPAVIKMSLDEFAAILIEKIDFNAPIIDRGIIEQFVEKIVPRNTLEFDWYLNLIPHIFEDNSSTGYNEVWTFVINFDEAEKYRKLRGGFLRKNQWRDLTVHVFV